MAPFRGVTLALGVGVVAYPSGTSEAMDGLRRAAMDGAFAVPDGYATTAAPT